MRLGRSRPAAAYIIIKRQPFAPAAPAGPPVGRMVLVNFAARQHPRRTAWHMTSKPMPPAAAGPSRRRWVWVS